MTDLGLGDLIVAGASAVAAGAVNALAGGGTLISFPALTALGVPAIQANATNTVSLCPGYLSGTFAQRNDLAAAGPQRARLAVAALGGLSGSVLLVLSSENLFRAIVPFLILAACVLLALQAPLRRRLVARRGASQHRAAELLAVAAVAVYGGYFGAGFGIMLLAALGLLSDEPLPRLNAVKQLLSVAVNVFAALFLAGSGEVVWAAVLVMAPGAAIGGTIGGRLARIIPGTPLRMAVVAYGLVVAAVYFVR